MTRSTAHNASFSGAMTRFVIETRPGQAPRPVPFLDVSGTLAISDAPEPFCLRQATLIKVERGGREAARFSLLFNEGDVHGFLSLPAESFDVLMTALGRAPQGRFEIEASVELPHDAHPAGLHMDVGYFSLAVV